MNNLLCIVTPIIFIVGILVFVFANRRRTLYRPVGAEEQREVIDPYEMVDKARRKLVKKAMLVWGALSFVALVVAFTWQVAVMSMV